MEDDDFCEEIQDIGNAQTNTHLEEGKPLFVQTGTEMEWLGIRRRDRESVQHHTYCFGINQEHPNARCFGPCCRAIATLALGSRPRQRGCKGAGQEEARESHQRLPGV